MRIQRKDVDHVADLSRLHLTEAEREKMTRELNSILGHVDKLGELDTSGIEPTFHVLKSLKNVTREDRVIPGIDREAALQNAPAPQNGSFAVPKTVE
ncbi:MAG: Asp-tRNA(Asn)/Glu-tRNA(Gln) amidotransferase subunit GatC [Symbiobacteriia bacterium]